MRRRVWIVAVVLGVALGRGDGDAGVRRHRAAAHAHRVQTGAASFYGRKDAGRTTASGTPLALNRMTAASPTLPLGTKAKVTNTETGQSAQVMITDRGPYAKGRVIDVTPKAAARIGIAKDKGVAPVKVKPVSVPQAPPQ